MVPTVRSCCNIKRASQVQVEVEVEVEVATPAVTGASATNLLIMP